jgi:hypothetical protein
MAVRSINELERSYLPIYYSDDKNSAVQKNPADKTSSETPVVKEEKLSIWQKIVRFFKNLLAVQNLIRIKMQTRPTKVMMNCLKTQTEFLSFQKQLLV